MVRLERWQRTLYAVAIAQFIALGGGNLVFPFIPFYIKDLGVSGEGSIALWSGLMGTATGGALFVFSPIWGSLADRFGRKPLLLRAYLGATITMLLQGLAQNVWQLVFLRALQGMFVGTIPAATALVASSTPRERVAYALGVLQMALFVSQFVGPLVGGALAASIGIRPTFIGAAGFYLIAFLLVFTQVDEQFQRPAPGERTSFVGNLRVVFSVRPLLVLIGFIFFLNAGPAYIRPLIPIVIDSYDIAASSETLSGVAFAAMAVTSAIAALAASRLADRAGARMALAAVTIGAGAAYLPVAIAGNVPALLILVAVVGLFSGAMIPLANTLIDAWAPPGKQASAFGLTGSALALAFAIAPLTGGIVASTASIEAAFIAIGVAMIGVGLVVPALVQEAPEEPDVEPVVVRGGE